MNSMENGRSERNAGSRHDKQDTTREAYNLVGQSCGYGYGYGSGQKRTSQRQSSSTSQGSQGTDRLATDRLATDRLPTDRPATDKASERIFDRVGRRFAEGKRN
jgi:hypothetical protein